VPITIKREMKPEKGAWDQSEGKKLETARGKGKGFMVGGVGAGGETLQRGRYLIRKGGYMVTWEPSKCRGDRRHALGTG